MGNGLDFVYVDVNIFDSPACMRIRRKYGNSGLAIFIRIVLEIAKNGYFLQWDEEKPLDLADDWRMSNTETPVIQGVVDACLDTQFYSREVFEACGVLTGEQVQENFKQANAHRQRPLRIDARYWLISRDGMPTCITFSDGKQGRTVPNTKRRQTAQKTKQEPQEQKPPQVVTEKKTEEAPPESTEWGNNGYMNDM